MAVKRLKPIQDTFIVPSTHAASFGGDEILELGFCRRPGSTGASRILMEFMVNEAEALLEGHSLVSATLNLKYAHGENLPSVYGIDVTQIHSEWTEGEGHIWDMPGFVDGASWTFPKGVYSEDRWNGGTVDGQEYPIKSTYYTGYQKNRDIRLDVTEWVYGWLTNPDEQGLGFLIGLSNEKLAMDRQFRLCFYSSETHTVYAPYLELIYDDSVRDLSGCCCDCHPAPVIPVADVSKSIINVKNLKESYYLGDKVRIDLSVCPEYPKRVFTTSSLYADTQECLLSTYWGIRDEYTGEMWVPFDDVGTRLSYDDRGNFFILDTDLLEPERFYRLLFEVDMGNGVRKIYDSKNIFRVTRNGEL